MTTRWLPVCRCRCGTRLEANWWCPACARSWADARGHLHWCTPAQHAYWHPFLTQYRLVRDADGYRRSGPEYYQRLPEVDREDREWSVWQVRQQSYAVLLRRLLTHCSSGAARVLDLGSGCGWLAARLAQRGYDTVAVDVLDDDADGLGALRHFDPSPLAVVADYTDLPFEPGQFDVVIFNGSLHYTAQPARVLTDAAAQLRPGGLLVVMDSPVFVDDVDGALMCMRRQRHFRERYGLSAPIQSGLGYLTFDALDRAAATLSREATFVVSRGPVRWEAGRWWRRLLGHDVEPSFGVWVAA